jgi:glycosyltransferase involved in cell wall biosynthesis
VISVVVPVFNERASLTELHRELSVVADQLQTECEFLFVDDGSTDGSWAEIKQLQKSDVRVRGLRFRRNFGKSAALAAGFRSAKGQTVITMDADLQDDPKEIPKLLDELDKGLDLVSGWKRVRYDPWHKVLPSRLFNYVVGKLTGVKIHDHNCGFKCYRAEAIRDIRLYGEFHRFIPVLVAAHGYLVGEVPVNHRPRRHGHSKYGATRFYRGFLDLMTVKFLTSYSRRPQHLLGSVGLLGIVFGIGSLAYLALTWVLRRMGVEGYLPLHERALLYFAMAALLFGSQLLSMGFLAELMTAQQMRESDTYNIAEEV